MLKVHVQPGAKNTAFSGEYGDSLKIRLAAPPVDGKANRCLRDFLSKTLSVPKQAVEIVSGETSRDKCIKIDDPNGGALQALSKATTQAN